MKIIEDIKTFYKQIKELNESISKLSNFQEKLDAMINSSISKDWKLTPGIRYTGRELYSSLAIFDEDMDVIIKNELAGIQNDIQQCIIMYDTLLYKSVTDIDGYIGLMRHIKTLEQLKAIIMQYFTGDAGAIFQLYFMDTEVFRSIIATLPTVDENMLYISNNYYDIDKSAKHIVVVMNKSEILLMSNNNRLRMTVKYRKTVIRVLYSIYRGKLFLYHLDTMPRRD